MNIFEQGIVDNDPQSASPLLVLAERVEKLTGPCRETDGLIYRSIDPVIENCWKYWNPTQLETIVPRYTGSAGEAFSLLPKDYYIELRRHSDGWYCWVAEHSKFRDATPWISTQRPSPELAIISPSLRARATLDIRP